MSADSQFSGATDAHSTADSQDARPDSRPEQPAGGYDDTREDDAERMLDDEQPINDADDADADDAEPVREHLPPERSTDRPVHSMYPDGTPVHEGMQPEKVRGPDPAAEGPHTVIKRDAEHDRVYKAREYNAEGHPVRDIDFTHPTYPSGRPRPDHAAPEEHPYIPNDPDNPRAGFKRGKGKPLDTQE